MQEDSNSANPAVYDFSGIKVKIEVNSEKKVESSKAVQVFKEETFSQGRGNYTKRSEKPISSK